MVLRNVNYLSHLESGAKALHDVWHKIQNKKNIMINWDDTLWILKITLLGNTVCMYSTWNLLGFIKLHQSRFYNTICIHHIVNRSLRLQVHVMASFTYILSTCFVYILSSLKSNNKKMHGGKKTNQKICKLMHMSLSYLKINTIFREMRNMIVKNEVLPWRMIWRKSTSTLSQRSCLKFFFMSVIFHFAQKESKNKKSICWRLT